uniref:Uncharacterized protein n=1 Tax=Sphaerodactylus townsendi TaxID=933632 RepID=A0ACB8G8R6_9SAUR
MQTKMLAVLLVSWLALARSATVPSEGAAIEPQEHIVQEPIDRLEDFPLQTLLQEELDPFGTHVEQREVFDLPLLIHGEPSSFSPRGRRPVGRPHYTSTLADFPPGRPSLSNIDNICAEGRQKASYKPWSLPRTGFSHLRRQGDALNNLEASLSQCCRLSEDEKLNCSQAAWSDALENFCKAEFMVKTKQYVCCKQKESRRSSCFARAAPFPNYDYASKTSGCAHGDPARCNPEVPVGSEKLPALFFPPGRPSEANIKNICKLRKFRPVYSEDSLPQTGFGWFVRQAWAVNRLEKEFKKCCPKEDVRCAQRGNYPAFHTLRSLKQTRTLSSTKVS